MWLALMASGIYSYWHHVDEVASRLDIPDDQRHEIVKGISNRDQISTQAGG